MFGRFSIERPQSCVSVSVLQLVSGFLFAAIAVLLLSQTAQAATPITWSGVSNTTWATGTNWVGNSAPANDLTSNTALFNGTFTNQPNYGTTSVAGLIIGDGTTVTNAVTFTGTALSLGTSGIMVNANAGAVTLNNAVKLGGSQTWSNFSASTFTVGATITNVANITPFTLAIDGSGATTLSGIISNGGTTGTTGLTKKGAGNLNLTAANTFTGATIVDAGTLTLSGLNGALALSASPISLAGGLLNIGNGSAGASVNNNNRIADTQAISLSGGSLALLGSSNSAATPTTETVGAITQGAGADSISVTYNAATAATTLTAASFIHSAGNAATLINGTSLGKDSTSTASVGRFLLTATPTLVGTTDALSTGINGAVKNTKIVSYLVGEATSTTGGLGTATGNANTFLTYNATTGLRPLNLTDEFTQNATTAGNNIWIRAGTTTSTVAINSLIMNNTTVGGNLTITDGQSLTVTSGAVLFASSNIIKPSSTTGILDFGSAEAMVIVNSVQTGTISAPITGSGGLTKSGMGILALSGANTYTGPTTIAAGILSMSGTSSLPGWNAAGNYTVASGAVLAVGNAVTDANITAMLSTNNFAVDSSLGFDTTAGSRTYTTTLTSTLGLAKIGTNNLTLGTGDNTVASVLLDGAGTLALPGNVTTSSLTLQNSSGAGTTTGNISISSGKTLTVNGAVRAGSLVDSHSNTFAISGATSGVGTLVVNSATSDFSVGDAYQTATSMQTLDMSTLGTFTATVNRLKVGYGEKSNDRGVLKLANTNTITASSLEIGSGVTGQTVGRLDLGASNTFNVDAINVGSGVLGNCGMMFASSGSVTIRGQAGGSSAAILNESFGSTATSNFNNQVDFTGGVLDAKFGTSTVGQDGGSNQVHSSVLAIGQTSGAGADFTGGTLTSGRLNANPGTAAVTKIPGMVYIGTATGTATMTASAIKLADNSSAANTCNMTGTYVSGILTIGQNASLTATSIQLGQASDTIALTNAAVNLNHGGMLTIGAGGLTTAKYGTTDAVSTLSFDGGVLKASSAGSLVGSGAGTLSNVTVLAGGGTIDSNGYNVSIDQAITAGVGNGISTLGVTAGGNSYVVAPYVQITDATGTGASAFAKINSAGQVTSIVVTNAGQNYTSPTITLLGGAGSAATANVTLASVTGGGLTKTGAGTLTLNTTNTTNTTNTYSGSTTIANGSITINNVALSGTAQALGTGTVLDLGVASTSSGTLIYTGGAGTFGQNINALGNGTDTIQNSGTGLLTLSGALTKNGTVLTLKGGANGITVSGSIAGSSANSDLIIDGGTTTLASANTYNGPTFIINGATLNANVADALPTANGRSAVSMDQTGSGSSTLVLGNDQSIASLTGSTTSAVNLGGNTLTVGSSSGSATFAGAISGTGGSLRKDGASTMILSGTSSYTGVTYVTAGTMIISATGNIASSSSTDVSGGNFTVASGGSAGIINVNGGTANINGLALDITVNANGTLTGSGSTGAVVVKNLGTLAPGNAGSSSLTVSSLALTEATPKIKMVISNNASYDRITVTGSTTLAGTFQLKIDNALTAGTLYLFAFGSAPSGHFANMNSSEGFYSAASWSRSSSLWTASGTGDQLLTFDETNGQLTVVPEPQTWALLAFSLTAIIVFRRRSRSR